MIVSFGSKNTEKIWDGEKVRKIPIEIQQIGRRKLRMLNNSQNISDLTTPPSNRLEKLSGNLRDLQYQDQRSMENHIPMGRRSCKRS
jgi:proteic killer suppression protein